MISPEEAKEADEEVKGEIEEEAKADPIEEDKHEEGGIFQSINNFFSGVERFFNRIGEQYGPQLRFVGAVLDEMSTQNVRRVRRNSNGNATTVVINLAAAILTVIIRNNFANGSMIKNPAPESFIEQLEEIGKLDFTILFISAGCLLSLYNIMDAIVCCSLLTCLHRNNCRRLLSQRRDQPERASQLQHLHL